MRHLAFLLLFSCATSLLSAQPIQWLTSGTKTHIRGLSVVNEQVIWVSGNNGTIGKSTDGGRNWQWTIVPGFEKRDFRDIEAFDENTAVIIAIAEPGNILKTSDGGKNWKIVFTDSTKGMFLDAMDFSNEKNGIVVGDPVNGKFFLAHTQDGGDHWATVSTADSIRPKEGEAFFAASGTNIRLLPNSSFWKEGGGIPGNAFLMVSGGTVSRLHNGTRSWALQLMQGKETTGANSIAIDGEKAVVVGGDFAADTATNGNCVLLNLSLNTSLTPDTPPHGYRSCVAYITPKKLITCSTSGVDVSGDGGMNWQLVTRDGFHVCRKAKKGNAVFLAGSNGRVAKLNW